MRKLNVTNHKIKALIIPVLVLLLSSCSNFECENCVLKPDTKYHYTSIFTSEDTVINYDIEKRITKGWFLLQNKMVYEIRPVIIDPGNRRIAYEYTGFIQNEDRLWLHPTRSEEYRYLTQLAPFPEVKYPIALGDTISGSIHMMGSWGEWNGKRSSFFLEVTDTTFLSTPLGNLKCWVFEGIGHLEQDTAWSNFYFNKEIGFVKMEYKNNRNEEFVMELSYIKDNL